MNNGEVMSQLGMGSLIISNIIPLKKLNINIESRAGVEVASGAINITAFSLSLMFAIYLQPQ